MEMSTREEKNAIPGEEKVKVNSAFSYSMDIVPSVDREGE